MFKRGQKIKVSSIDFYLSKENVEPINKISGNIYIVDEEIYDGKCKVSFSANKIFPTLDIFQGYVKASDLEKFKVVK